MRSQNKKKGGSVTWWDKDSQLCEGSITAKEILECKDAILRGSQGANKPLYALVDMG